MLADGFGKLFARLEASTCPPSASLPPLPPVLVVVPLRHLILGHPTSALGTMNAEAGLNNS
eukprot:751982-Hanusia_phi.AAC.7